MDKINMMNYQQYVLKKKFKKNQTQEKKGISLKVILVLLAIFFSLGFFLNVESLVVSGSSVPGFPNLGAYHG